MYDINNIIRPNIKELKGYSSARSEYDGVADVYLDANENPYGDDLNRYPDPYQTELKRYLSNMKGVATDQIFVGNGSDEAIDLLFRAFCTPGKDNAFIFSPTYGMYAISAGINNVSVVNINLDEDYNLPSNKKINSILQDQKGLIFICTPNNPTGNTTSLQTIKRIADSYNGIVVVDEAYIDFCNESSAISMLRSTPNIVVLQTMSKAYGCAGLRVGFAYGNAAIIEVLNKIKPPYNISTFSQKEALRTLKDTSKNESQIKSIISERLNLVKELSQLDYIEKIYPSESNFVLVLCRNADATYNYLRKRGIIIRNRTKQIESGLRITVGTPAENQLLISALKEFQL